MAHARTRLVAVAALAAGTALADPAPSKVTPAPPPASLCAPAERLVFTCDIASGRAEGKTASLCLAGKDQLVYRFGTRDKVELTYPAAGVTPTFKRERSAWVSGVTDTVTFTSGAFVYEVSSTDGFSRGPWTGDGSERAHHDESESSVTVTKLPAEKTVGALKCNLDTVKRDFDLLQPFLPVKVQ